MLTIGELPKRAARLYPGKTATWFEGKAQSFGDFFGDVLAYRYFIETAGLEPGDRVAVLSRNNPDLLKIVFAAALGGFVVVPVNFRLTAKEIGFLISDSGIRLFFADRFFIETAREAASAAIGAFRPRIEAIDSSFVSQLRAGSNAEAVPRPKSSDLFAIFYTSGTTGNPKGVMLSHDNMMAGVINHTIAYGLNPSDICLHLMPLYHTMEASLAFCQFLLGGTNVIEDHFDKQRFWEIVDTYGVTHVTAVFTMLSGMLETARESGARLGPTLRTIGIGGQSVPIEVMKTAIARLGEGRLFPNYGLTEAAPLLTFMPKEDVTLSVDHEQRLASVGRDMFLTETRIVDENDRDVAPGERGEVVARGPNVMLGYWNNPEETVRALRDGWLHTGDIGRRDEDGFLYLVDRKKDLIISGGENISPREVEEVIFAHPLVVECSVFGVSDAQWGETTAAAVVTNGELGQEALLEHCAKHLARYKLPRTIWFLDELPKDPVGKIQKRVLKARLAATSIKEQSA